MSCLHKLDIILRCVIDDEVNSQILHIYLIVYMFSLSINEDRLDEERDNVVHGI